MKSFDDVIINDERYLGLGFFNEVSSAIVIESDELISLFKKMKLDGEYIYNVDFVKKNEIIASYKGKYIVDHINNIEAELFSV
ncbi:hypothetical protein [Alkalihalophilus marmarensis]|uniref:Uncharacterized protein n=1 Tax=Alkalihalophilus marmarensis DSM 21297 TaxID=1188261 RepID=U6SRT2_9BACI|nr:hypothetical protein [Alkalihalophilus marmarensis]ERN54318.1 hypothetical protein A33I_07790 [Alkalihalophilus marmarensis DSM 21297]